MSQDDKKVCRLFIDIVEHKQYSITKREDLETFSVYVLRSRISSVERCSMSSWDNYVGRTGSVCCQLVLFLEGEPGVSR